MAETVQPATIKTYGLEKAEIETLNAWYAGRDTIQKALTPLQGLLNGISSKIAKLYDEAGQRKRSDGPWFKWIKPGGVPTHAASKTDFRYDLPQGKRPGKWHKLKATAVPVACSVGFHVVKADRISEWKKDGAHLYLVEVAGKVAHDYNKSAFSEIRIMQRVTPNQAKAMAAKALAV